MTRRIAEVAGVLRILSERTLSRRTEEVKSRWEREDRGRDVLPRAKSIVQLPLGCIHRKRTRNATLESASEQFAEKRF